jgi:hypothetical protein
MKAACDISNYEDQYIINPHMLCTLKAKPGEIKKSKNLT